MTTDAKIVNKILANCIQHYTKKMVDHNHLRDARIIQYSRINKYSTSINNMKKKTHDHNNRWWKIFAIIQHPLMIKKIQHYGREGAYLNIIKAIYESVRAKITLKGQKQKCFTPKMKKKTRVSALTTSVQHSIGSSSYSNQTRQKK